MITRRSKAKSKPAAKMVREILTTLALAGLVFFLVHSTLRNFQVEGFSMEPSLDDGQLLLINKAVYSRYNVSGWVQSLPFMDRDGDGVVEPFHPPRRGEVVVFRSPESGGSNLIKRIIAVPGDVIEIRSGAVSVNGQRLDESAYVDRPGTFSKAATTVPEDQYWVMGDNRTGSSDSRSFGPIPRENIVGKTWVSYWPLSHFGFVGAHSSFTGR